MDDIIRRCHEILHLPETATREEVREAYNKIVHSGNLRKEEWEKTKEIDWAYETLMRSFPETEEVDRQDASPTLQETPYVVDGSFITRLKDLIFAVEEKTNPLYFYGRVILFLGAFIWGWVFIFKPIASNYTGESFLHLINLPFHEAGHILFSFFGRFLQVLGRKSPAGHHPRCLSHRFSHEKRALQRVHRSLVDRPEFYRHGPLY